MSESESGMQNNNNFFYKNRKIIFFLFVVILAGAILFAILYKPPKTNTTTNPPMTTMIPMTTMPPGQMPSGQMSIGQMLSGPMPPGQMPLELEDMPAIKNILDEIGKNQPTPEQIERLEKAVKSTILEYKTTAQKIVDEAKNAPIDSNGRPMLDIKIKTLYFIMLALFMASDGKYFRNEIGPEIEKSYASMPEK